MKKKTKKDLAKIEVMLMDLDGCLTTGHIIYSSNGQDTKVFHTHDGYGIVRARELGLKFAIISGMSSKVNRMRNKRLKIHHMYENIDDKTIPFEELKLKYNLKAENFAYIGDDEFDLPLLRKVGFSCCPNSGIDEVKKQVDYVCKKNGGEGAVREVVDMILKAKNLI